MRYRPSSILFCPAEKVALCAMSRQVAAAAIAACCASHAGADATSSASTSGQDMQHLQGEKAAVEGKLACLQAEMLLFKQNSAAAEIQSRADRKVRRHILFQDFANRSVVPSCLIYMLHICAAQHDVYCLSTGSLPCK